jgi:hypothetical protein
MAKKISWHANLRFIWQPTIFDSSNLRTKWQYRVSRGSSINDITVSGRGRVKKAIFAVTSFMDDPLKATARHSIYFFSILVSICGNLLIWIKNNFLFDFDLVNNSEFFFLFRHFRCLAKSSYFFISLIYIEHFLLLNFLIDLFTSLFTNKTEEKTADRKKDS